MPLEVQSCSNLRNVSSVLPTSNFCFALALAGVYFYTYLCSRNQGWTDVPWEASEGPRLC